MSKEEINFGWRKERYSKTKLVYSLSLSPLGNIQYNCYKGQRLVVKGDVNLEPMGMIW